MRTMRYTTENTEGYSSEDLVKLNRIYEQQIALLNEDERENADLLQHISEEVLADYDLARDLVPDALLAGEGEVVPISRIVDLEIRGSGDERAAVALVDLDGCEGVLAVIYPGGVQITQGDWQSPSGEIPADLSEVRWQDAPAHSDAVIVCGDGLPRALPGLW